MKPEIARMCGVPSNCLMCRTNPDHRRVIGWPDECPRGYTVDRLPREKRRRGKCGKAAPPPSPGPPRLARLNRQAEKWLCAKATPVQWMPCCGGHVRPAWITCAQEGNLPFAACFNCGDYERGEKPAKRPQKAVATAVDT
jgi:hypothetical protein